MTQRTTSPDPFRTAAFIVALVLLARCAFASTTDIVTLRGRPQLVHLYGTRSSSPPVIVSSGDGGWIHLGPHIAQLLAARGYFVVGFNAKEYLESFTTKANTLQPAEVPGDYRALVRYTADASSVKPILIGVSEGAGLSVLAAADGPTKAGVGGVIAIGLPDVNELGWRWKDSWIYVTHGIPNEPTFSSAALVGRMAPLPLAAIHSTRDEFVPINQVQQTMARASDPKKLWVIQAADHRFSDNLSELDRRLLEAMTWVRGQSPQ
jgi:alpha-beta hydrolase superfamily lysophospholipase